jgi:hypothetical protein
MEVSDQVLPDYIEVALDYRSKMIFILNSDRLLSDEEEKMLEARIMWLLQKEAPVCRP